jgi:hypothetical protein
VGTERVAAVDSAARQNTNFEAARTPAVLTRETFQFDSALVDSASTYALSLDELRLLRGLVFGRHGRRFADDAFIQTYLESQSWYKADSAFTNERLNDMERRNLDIIRGAEAARHDRVMPGDIRYHRGRLVTSAMLGHHTREEWDLLVSEPLAMNGHRFYEGELPDSTDIGFYDDYEATQLQRYYNDRYWYRGVAIVHRDSLNEDDRALLDTIEVARLHDLGLMVTFGMSRVLERTLLTEDNLKYNSLLDLRLMRNEVFARHGREFTTPWIRKALEARGYRPSGTFRDSDLNDFERQNVALIRKVEEQKHEALSTYELRGIDFKDYPLPWVRLLRNELYARHGRVFKDKTVQSYFASLPWYKANPLYHDSLLTVMERKNVQTLLAHEKLIGSGGRYPEA